MESAGGVIVSLAAVAAVLGVFNFGLVVAFIGSIKLRLAERLSIDDARIGRLIAVWQVTSLVIMLFVGPLLDRFGHRPILITGFLIVALSILLFATSEKMSVIFSASFLLGVGGSCVNAGGNTLLPAAIDPDNPAAASNLGNVFFGLGAFVMPFVLAYLFERMSFRGALSVFAVIAAVAVVPAALADYPQVSSGFELSAAVQLAGNTAVWIAALCLFCYIGLEVSMASWTTTYLRNVGWNEKRSTLLFSLFWVAMMAGRLATSRFVTTEVGRTTIQVVVLAAAALILVMTMTSRRGVGAVCVILLGLCFAPIFPTTVGLTFARFEPALYGSVFALIFAVGLLGSSVVPAAIGSISKQKSIRPGMRILVALAALLFLLSFGLSG
jgi:MFS transporter, FHS family, glucose/mannose:H+ symporter